ncbi:MAG TPA: hypothetical protein VFT82_00390 [Candidatus Paceibacterota bacterium]|nr:hypothetical protein [Candidatus Paceibacterota bacterium]
MEKFLSKPALDRYRKKVFQVLERENFIIDGDVRGTVEQRISNGRRYFFIVAKRNENGTVVERFLKIPQNNTKKLLEPFERQIEFARYIKDHTKLNTRGVIAYNVNPKKGVPFAIMETFPLSHAKIGFIEGSTKSELLGEREARNVLGDLQKFHEIRFDDLPPKLRKLLKKGTDFNHVKRSVRQSLMKKVLPLDAENGKREILHKLLERRLGIPDFKKKIERTIAALEPVVNSPSNKGRFVTHGDMAPNNLYVFNDGTVEFLDLEWVGYFTNRVIAMIYDFGNMRARAWKNPLFRNELDKELVRIYRARGEEKIANAIICLSILRSNVIFSGFFENYPLDKQERDEEKNRKEATENEIKKIWDFGF